ncbi:MAG: hypothetical protein IJT00_09255, partial [Lachnospiraceae bacterium]|nr:hypothetical protein [Lachnospiraceae bacterium]
LTGTSKLYGNMVIEPVFVETGISVTFKPGADFTWKNPGVKPATGTSGTVYSLDENNNITFNVDVTTGITKTQLKELTAFLDDSGIDTTKYDFYGWEYAVGTGTDAKKYYLGDGADTDSFGQAPNKKHVGPYGDYIAQGSFPSGTEFTAVKYTKTKNVTFDRNEGHWEKSTSRVHTGRGLDTGAVYKPNTADGQDESTKYKYYGVYAQEFNYTTQAVLSEKDEQGNETWLGPDEIYIPLNAVYYGTTTGTGLAEDITREKYDFAGWEVTTNGTVTSTAPVSGTASVGKVRIGDDSTIKAKWETKTKVDVTLNWETATPAMKNLSANTKLSESDVYLPVDTATDVTKLLPQSSGGIKEYKSGETLPEGLWNLKVGKWYVSKWLVTSTIGTDEEVEWKKTDVLDDDVSLTAIWVTDVDVYLQDGGISGSSLNSAKVSLDEGSTVSGLIQVEYGQAIGGAAATNDYRFTNLATLKTDGTSGKNETWAFDSWYFIDQDTEETRLSSAVSSGVLNTTSVNTKGVALAARYNVQATLTLNKTYAQWSTTGIFAYDYGFNKTTGAEVSTAVSTTGDNNVRKVVLSAGSLSATAEKLADYEEGIVLKTGYRDSTFIGWFSDEEMNTVFDASSQSLGENGILNLYGKHTNNTNTLVVTLSADSSNSYYTVNGGKSSASVTIDISGKTTLGAIWDDIYPYVDQTPLDAQYSFKGFKYGSGENAVTYSTTDHSSGVAGALLKSSDTAEGIAVQKNGDNGVWSLTLTLVSDQTRVTLTLKPGDGAWTAEAIADENNSLKAKSDDLVIYLAANANTGKVDLKASDLTSYSALLENYNAQKFFEGSWTTADGVPITAAGVELEPGTALKPVYELPKVQVTVSKNGTALGSNVSGSTYSDTIGKISVEEEDELTYSVVYTPEAAREYLTASVSVDGTYVKTNEAGNLVAMLMTTQDQTVTFNSTFTEKAGTDAGRSFGNGITMTVEVKGATGEKNLTITVTPDRALASGKTTVSVVKKFTDEEGLTLSDVFADIISALGLPAESGYAFTSITLGSNTWTEDDQAGSAKDVDILSSATKVSAREFTLAMTAGSVEREQTIITVTPGEGAWDTAKLPVGAENNKSSVQLALATNADGSATLLPSDLTTLTASLAAESN